MKGDFMRRILILLFFFISFTLSLPLLIIGMLIGKFNRYLARSLAGYYTRYLAWGLMALAGVRFIATGMENLGQKDHYLFVSNHRGLLDTPTLALYANKPLSFVSKKEMAKVPILKQWMDMLGCLFLDRKDNRSAVKTILKGIDYLKSGDNLAIYPQGTRSRQDEFLPFKQGSFKLALKSGVKVVPVAIKGTDVVLEDNGFNVKPAKVYVHFFEPIDLSTWDEDSKKHCATIIGDQIKAKYQLFGDCTL
ncbi:MAG: 1-acyl-sn-glycerol-3-phosphate acyltransferase [Firmicutes bacterium HGW-Firmicutes-3]|jgi:1-acyl-sn-glycerol-3-phosphate acyltransferase|nr:MAG: 1-acyl-sn-glycerol-3-phosphate acyltransferase [Firmicutes bacterium HGW-Firmicutes-3]